MSPDPYFLRLIVPVDFKTSGRVNWRELRDDIGNRVFDHTGLQLWPPVCEHRYNFTTRSMEAAKMVTRSTKFLRGVNRALPLAMLLSLPMIAEAAQQADTDVKTFVREYRGGGEWGSQNAMALSVGNLAMMI